MYTVKELIEALQQCPAEYTIICGVDFELFGDLNAVGIDTELEAVELFAESHK
jgi:hypothetical protein